MGEGGNVFLAFYAIFLILYAKCVGGGGCSFFFRKTILSHFMFSLCFMLFLIFLEKKKQNSGGGGKKKPGGGRSRVALFVMKSGCAGAIVRRVFHPARKLVRFIL